MKVLTIYSFAFLLQNTTETTYTRAQVTYAPDTQPLNR